MQWFESWFDSPYYHILYKDRDFEEARNFLDKLLDEIKLQQNSLIVDLACGRGRHSVYLNQKGYRVLGLDLSKESISFDKQFENKSLQFRVHDMKNPIIGEKADAVVNLFTSFGYFENDEDDEKVFFSVSDALKDNGLFVLDFLNADFVKNNLISNEIVVKNNIKFNVNRKIENNRVIKEISFQDGGENFYFSENVKLHSFDKLKLLAERHKFNVVNKWGDYKLNPINKNSPRCIILFQKSENK